jgi:hypothetical protein
LVKSFHEFDVVINYITEFSLTNHTIKHYQNIFQNLFIPFKKDELNEKSVTLYQF